MLTRRVLSCLVTLVLSCRLYLREGAGVRSLLGFAGLVPPSQCGRTCLCPLGSWGMVLFTSTGEGLGQELWAG